MFVLMRLLPVLMAAVVIGGCGGSASSRKQALGSGLPETRGASILTYVLPSDIQTMDPALIYDVETATVAQHVYRTLVKFAPDSVEIGPDAAEHWEVSADGLEYKFRLRAGMVFEDGSPLDAEAVRFSIERQTNSKHPAHVPGKMRYAAFLFGDESTSESALLKSIETPTSLTVVLRLHRPHVPFLRNLAMGAAAIVSPGAFAGGADLATMAGCGAYSLATHRPNEVVVLRRNPKYVGEPGVSEEIRFRVIRDASVRLAALMKGDVDIAGHFDPPALDSLRSADEVVLLEQPSLSISYLSINHGKPPFDDVRVRRALSLAIDRRSICESLYSGLGVPATGVIPSGMLGHLAGEPVMDPDPEAAKALLAEAGHGEGVDVVLTTQDRPRIYNPAGARLAEALQLQLGRAGFRVKLETTEFATFLSRVHARDYVLANSGWVTDNGDPDNFIYELVGREDNNKNYLNREATKLMREAAVETDAARREALYQRAERLVGADVAIIPINYGKQVIGARRSVTGLSLHPTGCTQLHKTSSGR